ncbi:NAD(P)-dependent oxidoreductase [Brevibacterium linens]|uniref:NADH-flavin reductase n=1 Tax=Brevibacterium linens TaxID=1703 RepID=A0A2H1I6N1_BRELN|nr:NAD(P)H-binding protein [Brevibacterium linens]SMX70790.1 Putative NADH-flavin reductase [Brevibacterium linens]
MDITVFGASGPTGLLVCEQALAAGHSVRAVSRRREPLPLPRHDDLEQVLADPGTGAGVDAALDGAHAALSALGAAYTRKPIDIYSTGTANIVSGLRERGAGRRLVVVSSGLTYPPPRTNIIADLILFPLLRKAIGRTLYADMRSMEEYLRTCEDIDWTVMRPGRLINRDRVSHYRLTPDVLDGGFTSRADLAAAMVAELEEPQHIHRAMAPATDRRAE